MPTITDQELSYWHAITPKASYPKLVKDMEVDVVIVGGGIAGMNAAYLLSKAGKKVVVLERETIGHGTTGNTTGKVTSQHGLLYQDLVDRLGAKTAQNYADAMQTAVTEIGKLIKAENISCAWQTEDNYVYTTKPDQIAKFRKEAETAKKLGLPASFETKLDLPFNVSAAVKFSNQAKFNAQAYVLGLAQAIAKQGGQIYEHTKALRIRDGMPAKVSTANGTVTAKDIIVATNVPTFPLMARGGYCALEYPTTSYIVAGYTDQSLSGMYISPDKDHYSILPVKDGKRQLVFIGGENHIPGFGRSVSRYHKLAGYARKYFGVKDIVYKWKARDYLAYDDVPLVGRLYPWSKHLYVATAFKKWGLTSTFAAGMILCDLILEQTNPWAKTFDSLRLKPIMSIPRAFLK